MPRLSLWRPEYSKDYYWHDRQCREYFYVGGIGIIVHKYLGSETDPADSTGPAQPTGPASPTAIQDLLLLENRDRKYSKDLYEIRGIYNQNDVDFDLSQFGLFLSSDTIFVNFHINDMVERMGRPLMNGDVLEFPNLKDPFALHDVAKALKRFYVVQDATRASEGFSPTWFPHVWRAKVGPLIDSQEYKDILGTGANAEDLLNHLSNYNKLIDVNDAVVAQAEADVPKSGYDTSMFWINPTTPEGAVDAVDNGDGTVTYGTPKSNGYTKGYLTGDAIAPNGAPMSFGTSFPMNPTKGDFFKRTDFLPARLFKWDGAKWVAFENEQRVTLTNNADRKTLKGTFINNTASHTAESGDVVEQRQNLNDLLKPQAD
jgi:hypothetical protein